MTTEPFEPESGAMPAGDTAPVAPVTPEMLDHAAHVAAEHVEEVAREAAARADEEPTASEAEPAVEAPAPVAPSTIPPMSEIPAAAFEQSLAAAAETSGAAASKTLEAADLAFNHGSVVAERMQAEATLAQDNVGRFNAKLLEIAAGNVAAAGELVSALMAAKSVPEAAAINADHIRRRRDTLTMQGRELLVLAQRAAFDALRPATETAREP